MKLSIIVGALLLSSYAQAQSRDWVAPATASSLKNPVTRTEDVLKEVKKLYSQQCALCHGEKGKGDGIAGVALQPKPADFTSGKLQAQTDGAIYWKLTKGRPPMAGYETILTDDQRWKMVHYLRSLGNK